MASITVEGYRLEAQRGGEPGLQLWRARSTVRDLPVLLQVWDRADAGVRDAVRALAAQRHPGLATVLDIGETTDGRLYVALAELPGPTLAAQLQQGLDLPMALAALRQVAAACAHLEQRAAPRAVFEPESILLDARLRPVLTRLRPASNDESIQESLRALGLLFFEALCGEPHAGSESPPVLPDYLQRWQPLIDGCLGDTRFPAFADLLAALDALEGRAPSRASAARSDAAKPAAVKEAAAAAAATASAASKPAAGPPSPPARAAASAERAPRPERVLSGPMSTPATPASPATVRITAPSKRVDPATEAAVGRPRLPAQPGQAPPGPPSRIPLYAAAGVALLAALAGLGVWLRSPDPADAPTPATALAPPASEAPTAAPPAARPRAPEAEPPVGFEAIDQVSEYELNPALEVELENLATVVDPVAQFILFGNTNLAAGRLVEPPQRNALDRFLLALRIEPDNREAQAGIAAVGERCLEGGREAIGVDALLQALGCAERVAAAHPAGRPAQRAAAELRERALAERLQAGQRALEQWRTSEAVVQFEQALRIAPASTAARSGLDEARRQGQPGYGFRDALAGGGEGPELRVVGRLAWGRHEVSVGEFGRYWESAGKAAFGARLPSCRDRESLLRSSRKRSWQSPDIPQSPEHPVVCVNFAMAAAFADWLSAQSGARYRLPTRAEWQAVAGAIPGQCAANFRDQAATAAWNAREAAACSDGHAYTAPVADSSGRSGLLGLWGNVAEWLADCDGNSCREHLAAGGSWFTPPSEVGVRGFAAEPGFTTIGLRVVRELPDGRD